MSCYIFIIPLFLGLLQIIIVICFVYIIVYFLKDGDTINLIFLVLYLLLLLLFALYEVYNYSQTNTLHYVIVQLLGIWMTVSSDPFSSCKMSMI